MLFGHEKLIAVFRRLAAENKLSHAYLFFGDAGIGKFSFAKSLAYFLEGGSFEPTGETLIDTGIFSPDEKNIIGIDAVRGLKRFLWQTPLRSPKRIAIINRAEALTTEAQSALLKIVEEPPRDSLIIFITCNDQVLFPPLLSRVAKVYFRRMKKIQIENFLIDNYGIAKEKAGFIAIDSFGRIGRAVEMMNGAPRRYSNNDNIELSLENKILSLRKSGILKNTKILSHLLQRETFIKRYNLNPNLQKKAAEYYLASRR